MSLLAQAASLLQSGDAVAARSLLLEAPEDSQRDFLLGACAHALGEIPQALQAFSDVLRRQPGHAPAACALGSLWAGLGHVQQAEALFRQTLARRDDAQLRFNLGVLLEDRGDHDGALAEYGRALTLDADHYGARHNRAGLAARLQRLEPAAADYRELIRRHPAATLAWHNLGELELALGHYAEAARLLTEVLARAPDNGKACLSLAVAHAAQGDITASRDAFARLAAIDPARWQEALARLNARRGHAADIDPRLIFLVRMLDHLKTCHWLHWEAFCQVMQDFARQPGDSEATALAFIALLAPLEAAAQRRLLTQVAAQVGRGLTPFRHAPRPVPARLRVGYAATRFGNHVTGHVFRQLLTAHDAATIETFIINLGPDDGSPELAALRTAAGARWLDLAAQDDAAAAEAIRALDLDVLVDLAIYNDEPRPEVMARRPAPVQVNWQGAAYTSGSPAYDYLLADAVVSPGEGWCSEAEVRLAGSYFCYSHAPEPPQVPDRASLGLPEQRFVFASLGAPFKLNPPLFDSWMRILAACPDSVLWLYAPQAAVVLNLKREAEWRGIDPRRLLFAPPCPPAGHLARQGAADLMLDTRPCNGHTTVAEALWAGTPVLTCPGASFASRVGASLLTSAGLPELVMADAERYEAEAIALYHDQPRLAALRARLADSRRHMPSLDIPALARQLETAYRQMAARHAAGLPPVPFALD